MRKVLLIFVVCALLSVAVAQKSVEAKDVYQKVDISKKQSEVNEAVLEKAQKGEWDDNDKNLKTFYLYYLYHNHIIQEVNEKKNNLDKEYAIDWLTYIKYDEKKSKENVDKCDPGKKLKQLDRAYEFSKCLQQNGTPIDVANIE